MIIIKIILSILLGCAFIISVIIDTVIRTVQMVLQLIDLALDYMRLTPFEICLSLSKFIHRLGNKKEEEITDEKKEEV